jgi:hypothetical protein
MNLGMLQIPCVSIAATGARTLPGGKTQGKMK